MSVMAKICSTLWNHMQFWLSKTSLIWEFWAFCRERMEGMALNVACWCIPTNFRTDYIMVMVCGFCSFWHHFHLVKLVSLRFLETHGRNGPKCGLLMHPDNLQKWLHFGQGLLIESFASGNDLELIWWQAIIWTIDDPALCCHMSYFGVIGHSESMENYG